MNRASPVVVVGGGIIGLAVARALQTADPKTPVVVLEKEPEVGTHQTGHSSGVVHSGIYYKPGSLKARLCTEGRRRLLEFCRDRGVRHEVCGKLILATHDADLPRLAELFRRGQANGVEGVRFLEPDEISEREPHARGLRGLFVPSTGIVDFPEVARQFARDLALAGGEVRTRTLVRGIREVDGTPRLDTSQGPLDCQFLVNCAGLFSDRLARWAGAPPLSRVMPFRGEYHLLRSARRELVRNLIYPVPDPELPFLGVHFTRTVRGEVEVGPNAIFAFAREGYRWTDVNVRDVWDSFEFPGFVSMVRRYGRTALSEIHRSLSRSALVRDLRQMLPEIRPDDLAPGGAGVRAQAVAADGRLIDDFVVTESPRAVHLLNVPSPASTASIAIGDSVRDLVQSRRK